MGMGMDIGHGGDAQCPDTVGAAGLTGFDRGDHADGIDFDDNIALPAVRQAGPSRNVACVRSCAEVYCIYNLIQVDLWMLLTNLRIATMQGGYGLVEDGAIEIKYGLISWIGRTGEAPPATKNRLRRPTC